MFWFECDRLFFYFTNIFIFRYVSVFNSLIGGIEEAQMVLLETVHTLWRTNHQMLTFVIDKFIKMSVLDLGVIVRFIFTSTRMEHDIQRCVIL